MNEIPNRLPPRVTTVKKLFAHSGNECAMPKCRRRLVKSNGTLVGKIAHISGVMPGSIRFDPKMSNEERRHTNNLVIVCSECHDLIDDPNNEQEFSIEFLQQAKKTHESRFRIAENKLIEELQAELDTTIEELSEYRCPYCNAPLEVRIDAPADPEEKHWDSREIFECGYQHFGGFMERPCPADPSFPKFDEYDLQFRNNPEETHFKWICYAHGKTDMAQRLNLRHGLGATKEEAKEKVRGHYDQIAGRANT